MVHIGILSVSHLSIYNLHTACTETKVWLFHPPVGDSLIYPTTWISRLKIRLVTVHGMSVLARRRAIMGSIVQPKRSCLGAATDTAESPHRWGKYHTYPAAKNPPTTPPLTLTHQTPHDSPATRQHTHACTVTNRVF